MHFLHVGVCHLAGIEQHRIIHAVAGNVGVHAVGRVVLCDGDADDLNLWTVLLLHPAEDVGEGGAVRAIGLDEFQDYDFAAVVGQIVNLHLGIGQRPTGGAAYFLGAKRSRAAEQSSGTDQNG
jgi:hypothetical protein